MCGSVLKQISYSKSSFQKIHNWFFSLRKLYAEILLSANQNAFKLYPAVLVVYTNQKKLLRSSLILHIRHKTLLHVLHMALSHWFSLKRHLTSEFQKYFRSIKLKGFLTRKHTDVALLFNLLKMESESHHNQLSQ